MSEKMTRKIKIACPGCGQKLDVTELPPFSSVNCPACSFELIVPKWFNNYLLEAPEGTGGMAVVYRALDIALDREVAIKIFDPNLAERGVSPGLFLHEARIAATINHPAVVPIYSCGECEGSAYIVMQYMGGGTLEQSLRKAKGRLPMMETCRWIRDVCEGLGTARELGIIHHDVKPANILLDVDSNARISDFGLSQAAFGQAASALFDPSKMWLSPNYVSPEKVRTGEEGPEGDVYSLGASFYHVLTGKPPFQAYSVRELVNMRITQDPISPDFIRPDITPALATLILDMMRRDPGARPTYADIVMRINDALRAIMRPAAPPPAAPVVTPAAPKRQERSRKVINVPAQRARRRARSGRLPLLLLLFLFFLMCSLCFLVFLPRFMGQRALLDVAPGLKILYGDLPPESFLFLSEDFYDSPMLDADFAVSGPDYPLETRYAAAWVVGVCLLLDDDPSAVESITEMGGRLRSAASLAGTSPPAADVYCLAVLSRHDSSPSKVYFSSEQQVRLLLGRLIRSLYDLEPDTLENGRIPDRILARFADLYGAFQSLPDGSWLLRLYGPRLRRWESALSGEDVSTNDLEPLFRRLLSGAPSPRARKLQEDAFSVSGGTFTGSPFGIPSSAGRSSED